MPYLVSKDLDIEEYTTAYRLSLWQNVPKKFLTKQYRDDFIAVNIRAAMLHALFATFILANPLAGLLSFVVRYYFSFYTTPSVFRKKAKNTCEGEVHYQKNRVPTIISMLASVRMDKPVTIDMKGLCLNCYYSTICQKITSYVGSFKPNIWTLFLVHPILLSIGLQLWVLVTALHYAPILYPNFQFMPYSNAVGLVVLLWWLADESDFKRLNIKPSKNYFIRLNEKAGMYHQRIINMVENTELDGVDVSEQLFEPDPFATVLDFCGRYYPHYKYYLKRVDQNTLQVQEKQKEITEILLKREEVQQ